MGDSEERSNSMEVPNDGPELKSEPLTKSESDSDALHDSSLLSMFQLKREFAVLKSSYQLRESSIRLLLHSKMRHRLALVNVLWQQELTLQEDLEQLGVYNTCNESNSSDTAETHPTLEARILSQPLKQMNWFKDHLKKQQELTKEFEQRAKHEEYMVDLKNLLKELRDCMQEAEAMFQPLEAVIGSQNSFTLSDIQTLELDEKMEEYCNVWSDPLLSTQQSLLEFRQTQLDRLRDVRCSQFKHLQNLLRLRGGPAAKEAIESLSAVVFEEESKELEAKERQCAVCLEDFALGAAVNLMPCGHLFHQSCILSWLAAQNTCPVCRFAVPGSTSTLP